MTYHCARCVHRRRQSAREEGPERYMCLAVCVKHTHARRVSTQKKLEVDDAYVYFIFHTIKSLTHTHVCKDTHTHLIVDCFERSPLYLGTSTNRTHDASAVGWSSPGRRIASIVLSFLSLACVIGVRPAWREKL